MNFERPGRGSSRKDVGVLRVNRRCVTLTSESNGLKANSFDSRFFHLENQKEKRKTRKGKKILFRIGSNLKYRRVEGRQTFGAVAVNGANAKPKKRNGLLTPAICRYACKTTSAELREKVGRTQRFHRANKKKIS